MGMYCEIRAVSPDDCQALLAGLEPETRLDGEGDPGSSVSLEKAWHGLHFLLTGSAWAGEPPLDFLLQGGEPVGEDLGYGPARLLQPEQVQHLDAALSDVSDEGLWSSFDATRMDDEQIYPGIWDEPEADLRQEYLSYFQELKRLVREARTEGLGLAIVVR